MNEKIPKIIYLEVLRKWYDEVYRIMKRAWEQKTYSDVLTVDLTEYVLFCAECLENLPVPLSGDEKLDFCWVACPILVANALGIPFRYAMWKSYEDDINFYLHILLENL